MRTNTDQTSLFTRAHLSDALRAHSANIPKRVQLIAESVIRARPDEELIDELTPELLIVPLSLDRAGAKMAREEIEIDVRIIAATNENLLLQAGEGNFREDLYHRLNEFTLGAIPLRRRKDDLEDFAQQFLEESNERLNKSVKGFSSEVWEIFLAYDWPGNLRELKNIIKRAVLLTSGLLVEKESLPVDIYQPVGMVSMGGNTSVASALPNELPSPRDYKSHWGEQEKELIQNVLNDTKFNKSKTARILKMDRKTLYSKMEKYGLD